jgi:hypothetical protein
MRSLALLPSCFSLAACLLLSSAARAEGDVALAPQQQARPFYVGITGGFAYATVRHPDMLSASFATPTLGLHAGYNVTDRWSVGLEVTTIEKFVERDGPGDPFVPKYPLAGCTNCQEPPTGGYIGSITAVFGTVAPRVEFTPFGRDGLFLGASAGLGFIMGVDGRIGGGGTARAGYRWRVAEVVGIALEGGIQGQVYKDASAVMPYGVLVLRPYF